MLSHRPSTRPASSTSEPRTERSAALEWLEERALRYVARWEASRGGVAELLEKKIRERCEGTDESPGPLIDEIPSLVERLVERGFVDDHRFASAKLERLRRQGRCTAEIRARLAGKGISDSLLDELFETEDPDAELRAGRTFARLRRLGPYCKDPIDRRRSRDRHLGMFGRRGFDYETALQIVDAQEIPT